MLVVLFVLAWYIVTYRYADLNFGVVGGSVCDLLV